MSTVRFTFRESNDPKLLEDNLGWALLMAQFVYGKPRLQLEAAYSVAEDGHACVLRADGEAGEAAARIFAGLTNLRVGEDGYTLEHVAAAPA